MKKYLLACAFTLLIASFTFGQVRPVDANVDSGKTPLPAPESINARYEGGLFGFSSKESGKLKFDDPNSRLVFYDGEGKESFSIPYDVIQTLYPQSKSVTSTTGNVISHIPLPGAGLAGFIKEKRRYMVIQFEDLVIDRTGLVNFKLESKELLDSAMASLAQRAKLDQRGESYFRPKTKPVADPN